MSRTLTLVALLIGLAAIALPSWAVWTTDLRPSLQLMAVQSCRCARLETNERGKAQCWEKFERSATALAENPINTTGTCAGLSPQTRCFDAVAGPCIVTGYRAYSPMIPEGLLCSRAEAAQAEALIARYGNDETGAEEAVRRLSIQFSKGDHVAAGRTRMRGCGG